MINVTIVGRLTKEPEERSTSNGITVTRLNIASKTADNKSTEFIQVVAWRTIAENCAKYLVKGQRVYVTGELKTREYNDKKITEVIASSVEFLDKPKPSENKNTFNSDDLQEIFNDDNLPF